MANNIDFIIRDGLQVMSNVAVGTYATNNLAPINGMIVSGNVGVGTATVPVGNVFAVYGKQFNYGNINLGNTGVTGATGTGIVFPDGTFQYTAATYAAGSQYSVQLNDGSGNFTAGNFLYDSADNKLGIGTSTVANYTNTIQAWGSTPAWFATTSAGTDYQILVGNTTSTMTTLGYNPTVSPSYGYLKASTIGGTNAVAIAFNSSGYVGITATTVPRNPLEVGGTTIIGSIWAGNTNFVNPPSQGLAVQGSVGVGTYTPLSTLDVNGWVGIRQGMSAAGTVTVASLVSNGAISGTTASVTALTATSIQNSGTTLVQSLNSNTNVVATNLQSTGQASVASLVSNGTINGTALTVTSLQNSGTTLVQSLNSNTNVVATNLQSTGQASVASLVSNGSISGTTINGTAATFTSLQNSGTTLVQSLNSNTNVVAANLQSTGQASVASLVSNGSISGTALTVTSFQDSGTLLAQSINSNTNVVATNLQSTGQASVASLVSNGSISGTTINGTAATFTSLQNSGTTLVQSLNSNTNVVAANLQSTGQASVASLVSNGTINGTDLTVTSLQNSGTTLVQSLNSNTNVVAANLQSTGQASVASLISNNNITTATLNSTGAAEVNSLISNTTVQVIGTLTAQTIASNTTVTAGTGLTVSSGGATITGASSITGNLTITGNLIVTGNSYITESNILVVNDPMIYLAVGNPSNSYDTGIVGYYNNGTYYHTGVVRDHVDGNWTVFDTLTTEPNTVINWNDATISFGGFKAGNIIAAGTTTSTNSTTGAIVINGTGGLGVGGAINAGGQIYTAGVMNAGGTAIVNSLISNGTISGTALTVTSFQDSGTLLAQSINSNTNVVAANLQSTGQASVASLVSNGSINGTALTVTSLQNSGTTIVQSLNSNTNVVAANLQSTGQASVASLVSNGTINGTALTVTSLQNSGTTIVQSLNSNTNVVATNLQSTGQATVASLVSNGTINGTGLTVTSLQDLGLALVNSLVSNNNIFGATISSSGQATLNSIVSNNNITTATLNSSGLVQVSNLTSNNNIGTGTMSASGAVVVSSLTSNTTIQSAGTATLNSIYANTASTFAGAVTITSTVPSTSAATGALIVDGGVGIAGNLNVTGNIVGSGNVTVFQGLAGQFFGNANGFGALYAGISSGYVYQSNTIVQMSANYNGYAQVNIQNINNSPSASTDYVATASNGTANDTYIDMGINSGTFSAGTVDGANDGYLYVAGNAVTGGGNLVIGTYSSNDIIFTLGNQALLGQEAARFSYAKGSLILEQGTKSTTTSTGALVINGSGGAGIGGNINVGGTRSTFSNYVGVGTSSAAGMGNVFSVYGNTNLYGNIQLSNVAAGGVGIYFADGTYITTAAASSSSTASQGVLGAVQFSHGDGTFQADATNFWWDATNHRLGLGTNSPGSTLDVNGNASFRSSISVGSLAAVGSLISNASIVGTTITGTTIQGSSNLTAQTITSNTSVTGYSLVLNGNAAAAGNTATTSGSVQITVDSFLTASYRTAHYIVQITDNTNSQYHSAQIMLIHDGTNVYKTEYNEIYSVQMLGTFDATITSGVLSLLFTPGAATNKTLGMIRTTVNV